MKFFIEIEELKVDTIIGVFEEERLKPQTILISIKCQLDIDHNQDLDNIENVTSYSDIKNEIIKFVSASQYKTLEKLISSKLEKREFKDQLILAQKNKKNFIIGEVKKQSPSAGEIISDYKPDGSASTLGIVAGDFRLTLVGVLDTFLYAGPNTDNLRSVGGIGHASSNSINRP